MSTINFKPTPTGLDLLVSEKFIKIMVGPVGGGKSTTGLFDLLARATGQAPFKNVRRTKFIILRNTMAQLKTTIKPLIDQWFITMSGGTFGAWRLSDNTYEVHTKLPDGTILHTEFVLMAADTPDDVRRLLSVECSAAWVEEAREVDAEVFDGLIGRTDRFPSRAAGGVTHPGVVCTTNPPPEGGFWHQQITKPAANVGVFIQPPALLEDGSLNPDAENIDNLSPTYYENLIEGKTEDWVRVYLQNKFGAGNLGLPIYRASFKRSFHVAAKPLLPVLGSLNPLIVGMDNGLQAAAAIGQQDLRGRVNILGEAYVPEDTTMGVESFLDRILIPYLNSKFATFPKNKIVFVLDPACFVRSQVDEKTIAGAVQARGFIPVRASTNDPEKRIAAVEGLLTRQIDGGPGFLIDPTCTHIADALEWGHRWKKSASGQTTTTADKTHHSHCFAAGTLVATPDGSVPIEQMTCDHKVLTPLGASDVAAVMSHLSDDLYELKFSDGSILTCTGDHPFFTARGIVLASALEYNEVLFSLGEEQCQKLSMPSKSFSASDTTASRQDTASLIGLSTAGSTCTGLYGSTTTGLFQRAATFTTSMVTRLTTVLKTLSAWMEVSTLASTGSNAMQPQQAGAPLWQRLRRPEQKPLNGTALTTAGTGTASTAAGHGRGESASSYDARAATGRTSGLLSSRNGVSALRPVKEWPANPPASMTSCVPAASAAQNFRPTNTLKQKHVVRVVGKQRLAGQSAKVYDLTVPGEHCFYANGVLVSNCGDAVQYLALHYNAIAPGHNYTQRPAARTVTKAAYMYA